MKKLATLLLALLLFTSTAYAASTIQAVLSHDIKVKFEGHELDMKDANGNPVYPIVYNGTTYLPVRSISEKLGLKVDWDGKTKTINLKNDINYDPDQKFYYGLDDWWIKDGFWRLKVNSAKIVPTKDNSNKDFKELIEISYTYENIGISNGLVLTPDLVSDYKKTIAENLSPQKNDRKIPLGKTTENNKLLYGLYNANGETLEILFTYYDEVEKNYISIPFIVPIER